MESQKNCRMKGEECGQEIDADQLRGNRNARQSNHGQFLWRRAIRWLYRLPGRFALGGLACCMPPFPFIPSFSHLPCPSSTTHNPCQTPATNPRLHSFTDVPRTPRRTVSAMRQRAQNELRRPARRSSRTRRARRAQMGRTQDFCRLRPA